jgi:hypothetical protein
MKFKIFLAAITLIINLERIKTEEIHWTKLTATVEQYPVDSLRILDFKKEATNVKVYIEINFTQNKVNLYLFLSKHQATELNLTNNDTKSFPGQSAYVFDIDIAYTNTYLRSYYIIGQENKADFFYHLNAVSNVPIDKQIENDFNGKENYDFFNDYISSGIQTLISVARNKKLSDLYHELSTGNREINTLFELVSLLHLTNNNNVNVGIIHRGFNDLVNSLLEEFQHEFELAWLDLAPLQEELNFYFNFRKEVLDKGKLVSDQKINKIINASIVKISKLVSKEFRLVGKFKYTKMLNIFGNFLYHKYTYYAANDAFSQSILDFIRGIMNSQVFYLGYGFTGVLGCDEKFGFFNQVKEAKIAMGSYDITENIQQQPAVGNQFSTYKTQFEEVMNKNLNDMNIDEIYSLLGIDNHDQILDLDEGNRDAALHLKKIPDYRSEYRKEESVPQLSCEGYQPKKRKWRRSKI